jgi:lauroyl/myristoyl acyltransferase
MAKTQNWLTTLAIEAETAICFFPIQEQDHYRWQVAEKIKKLSQQENNKHNRNNNRVAYLENKVIKNIKKKLTDNNAIIAKANKENSIIVMPHQDYVERIADFISSNQFSNINSDPTNLYQRHIRNVINSCKITIRDETKHKLINLNPSLPTIKGLIKVHKLGSPIRPIVNWCNAPAYKVAKYFIK